MHLTFRFNSVVVRVDTKINCVCIFDVTGFAQRGFKLCSETFYGNFVSKVFGDLSVIN